MRTLLNTERMVYSMKKLLICLTVLSLLLTSCLAFAQEYKMTMIMSSRDEFLSTLEGAAKDAAASIGNINLSTQDANNDPAKVLEFIEAARNAGEDAVIINLVDAETGAECIEAAGDMKVVFVNRCPSDASVLNERAVYVGSNEMHSGGFQGDFLAEYFTAQGKTEIKYILLQGTLGLVHTTNRTASVLQHMADGGLIASEAAAPLVAEYDRATAQEMISPLLTTVEYDCIIANNDAMALGAIEALKDAGLDPAALPIVGIDATADGIQALKDGELAMTVFQNPVGQGSGALIAAVNMLEGNAFNEGTGYEIDSENQYIVWVPFEPVYPSNVADYE